MGPKLHSSKANCAQQLVLLYKIIGSIPISTRSSFDVFCLEAHTGIFRLLVKGISNPYVIKVDFIIYEVH